MSILLGQEWRAKALVREFRVRDVAAEILPAAEALSGGLIDPVDGLFEGGVLLRSERSATLTALARMWTRGAVKSVPPALTAAAGLLRCWTLAAGRHDDAGFLLGLDRHAPDTYEPMASVCARAGLAAAFIGVRGGGPALRIVGHRRHTRLVELLGTAPPEAPIGAFPISQH